jgi:predicted nucleic acid-binding protein
MNQAFVLDVSVAASWLLDDDEDRAWQALESGAEAFVPTLWRYEIANALVVNERRGRVGAEQVEAFLESLGELPIYEEDAWPSAVSLVGQGRVHGLTAYDAAYLIVAQRLAIPLATNDHALRRAAESAGLTLL